MKNWSLLAESRITLEREALRAFIHGQIGEEVRRAGISAEFILASAVACWRQLECPPPSLRLALVWTNVTGPGTETLQVLTDLLALRESPMPYHFVASQPCTAAFYANRFLPDLVHATCLLKSSSEVNGPLLSALAHRKEWTHVILGAVTTPEPPREDQYSFEARWQVLERAT